jgi:hypothetical protein
MAHDENDTIATRQNRSRRWDASILIALASVLVALIFNALQVRNTARQFSQGQQSLAFTTLTNMSDRVTKADVATTKAVLDAGLTIDEETIREAAQNTESTAFRKLATTQAALIAAITPLDGVVTALDSETVPVTGATELWTNFLVCDYREVRDEFKREQAEGFDLEHSMPTSLTSRTLTAATRAFGSASWGTTARSRLPLTDSAARG